MITSDSRYAEAAHESAVCHLYNEVEVAEVDEMGHIQEISRDTTYLLTTQLGVPQPRQYMVKETDNIQLLAFRALQDPTRWWVVADANPHIRYPFDFVMGSIIHMPE